MIQALATLGLGGLVATLAGLYAMTSRKLMRTTAKLIQTEMRLASYKNQYDLHKKELARKNEYIESLQNNLSELVDPIAMLDIVFTPEGGEDGDNGEGMPN